MGLFGGLKRKKPAKKGKRDRKPKKGKKRGGLFGKKNPDYISQLRLQPVAEDALFDTLNQDLSSKDQPYVATDDTNHLIYLIALNNKLIGSNDLSEHLGDIKTAADYSNRKGDIDGSLYNASTINDLKPHNKEDKKIVFVPTVNTLKTFGEIVEPSQEFLIVSLPSDISTSNLDDYYDEGRVNAPIKGDNDKIITATLDDFKDFVKINTEPDAEEAYGDDDGVDPSDPLKSEDPAPEPAASDESETGDEGYGDLDSEKDIDSDASGEDLDKGDIVDTPDLPPEPGDADNGSDDEADAGNALPDLPPIDDNTKANDNKEKASDDAPADLPDLGSMPDLNSTDETNSAPDLSTPNAATDDSTVTQSADIDLDKANSTDTNANDDLDDLSSLNDLPDLTADTSTSSADTDDKAAKDDTSTPKNNDIDQADASDDLSSLKDLNDLSGLSADSSDGTDSVKTNNDKSSNDDLDNTEELDSLNLDDPSDSNSSNDDLNLDLDDSDGNDNDLNLDDTSDDLDLDDDNNANDDLNFDDNSNSDDLDLSNDDSDQDRSDDIDDLLDDPSNDASDISELQNDTVDLSNDTDEQTNDSVSNNDELPKIANEATNDEASKTDDDTVTIDMSQPGHGLNKLAPKEEENNELGDENAKALAELKSRYGNRIDEILKGIKIPVLHPDPKLTSDTEYVAQLAAANDSLKNDVVRTKETIKTSLLVQIDNILRDVTDPARFAKLYPRIDDVLKRKFVNEEAIKQEAAREISLINDRYEQERIDMIEEAKRRAEKEYQEKRIPERNNEIDKAEGSVRERHQKQYNVAVDDVLKQQRNLQQPLIDKEISNLLAEKGTAQVNDAVDRIYNKTVDYYDRLTNMAGMHAYIDRRLQENKGISPSENTVSPEDLQNQIDSLKMENERQNKNQNDRVADLLKQLEQSQKNAKQAQQAATNAQKKIDDLQTQAIKYRQQALSAKSESQHYRSESESMKQAHSQLLDQLNNIKQGSVKPDTPDDHMTPVQRFADKPGVDYSKPVPAPDIVQSEPADSHDEYHEEADPNNDIDLAESANPEMNNNPSYTPGD